MGCLISKLCPPKPPSQLEYDVKEEKIKHSKVGKSTIQTCQEEINSRPPVVPPRRPFSSKPIVSLSKSQNDQSRIELHVAIYVAIQSHSKTKADEISFEENDEMVLIKDVDASELHVNHLRTGLFGFVPKTLVRLDTDTPLRLAISDQGIIQRCLMQYNIPGAYLIRRSGSIPNAFVLSISQFNEQHNTFTWNYIIGINPLNNCFYFSLETKLQTIYFSSFQQLVSDERVREVIPLTEILPYSIEFDDEVWKIPYEELQIEQKIGEGQFGEVFRGNWHKVRRSIPVAMKKLHIRGMTSIVQRETEAMKKLTNLHIVTLYGIAQNPTTNEILLVTELMENGDLKSWLKQLPNLPEYSTLLRFSRDISSGMSYLEYRNYVHRDLACRNVLLGSNGKKVKIADFGLSTIMDAGDTDQRQEAHSQKLPTRWLAPELLYDQAAYSLKSDVWSFGILLIEIWLKGGDPYDKQIRAWIQSAVSTGHVHEKPIDCPDDFYQTIICQCLKFQANDRPSFSTLRQLLEKWQC